MQVPARRCSQSRPDASAPALGTELAPAGERRPWRQLRKRPLPSGRLQSGPLPGLLLRRYRRGGCRQVAALRPPGCQLWLFPLGLCIRCTQSRRQRQGDESSVCGPRRWRLTAWAALGCWPEVRALETRSWASVVPWKEALGCQNPERSWKIDANPEPAAICHQQCVLRTLWSLKEPRLHPSSSGTNGSLTSFHEHPR